MTGNKHIARGFRWAICAALAAFASSAAAQDSGKLSLRMSDELSLGAAAPRATPASAQASTMTASAQASAMPQMPASPRDYRIGPEDLLEIQVFGVDQLTRTVRVNNRGAISLPLIGTLEVGGLTAQQAEARVVKRLADEFLQDPQVSLFIKEYTSQRVIIEGAVNRPGVYPLRGPTTLLQSLAVAGGQGSLSDMSEVMLFRADANGQRAAVTYDVERIRSGELSDPTVVNDDLIVVKRSKPRILLKDSVLGDVLDIINPFK